MAENENRGSAPDFPFVERVGVDRESDHGKLRAYLQRNPDAVEPLLWLIAQWGAEHTFIEWFGEGWDEVDEDCMSGLPVFTARFVPDRQTPQRERAAVGREFESRFPGSDRHMNLIP